MFPVHIPVASVAQTFSAIEAAMAYCTWDGPAPNPALWSELNSARAFVKTYLLESCPALPIEIKQPAKVTA